VFATTRWTQVLAAHGNSADARQALSDLCSACYAPVVAFLRSEGRTEDAARELAHEFFARILAGQSLEGADPKRGRFRSYLLGALKHFLANRRVHDAREKRGGQAIFEALPSDTGTSSRPAFADPASMPQDALFDREWALNVLARALDAMKQEAAASDPERRGAREFEVLKPWLTADGDHRPQADAARELGLTDGAVRVAIHRLRRIFRERVKAEIARTVDEPGDIADELRHLIEALSWEPIV
jgi:RNA polymerase sigma-70 factor (ECF subfamily)